MTSTNKKGALLFVGGLVLGGVLASNHWSAIDDTRQQALDAINTELAQSQSELQAAQATLARQQSAQNDATSQVQMYVQQLEQQSAEIARMQGMLAQQSRAMENTQSTLEETTEAQSVAIAKLKQRVTDTDKLYAERYRLTKAVNELNEQILKGSHKLEMSQQACEEYKQGNSWNKVSKADCDNFNALREKNNSMIEEFDHVSADLDKVKRALSAYGNLPLPETP